MVTVRSQEPCFYVHGSGFDLRNRKLLITKQRGFYLVKVSEIQISNFRVRLRQ